MVSTIESFCCTHVPDGWFIFVLVESVEYSLFIHSQPYIGKLLTKRQLLHLNMQHKQAHM